MKLSKPSQNEMIVRVWRSPKGLRAYYQAPNRKAAEIFSENFGELCNRNYFRLYPSPSPEALMQGFLVKLEGVSGPLTSEVVRNVAANLSNDVAKLFQQKSSYVVEYRYSLDAEALEKLEIPETEIHPQL